ncbi:MAG TPA: hypothetical protein VFA18_24095 [Gemmataceae bacterium]|nr:hypothetical protein [Gemmataceae bacterium]
MCSNHEYRRRLMVFSHDRLARLHAEAGLLLDLKDSVGLRLAVNVAGQSHVRAALRQAQRRQTFAVLCLGIPRVMARALAAREPDALAYLDRLGPLILPVIIISTGGCSVAGISKGQLAPGLN